MLRLFFLVSCLIFSDAAFSQQTFTGTTGSIPDNGTTRTFTCNITGLTQPNINTQYGFEKITLNIQHNNDADLEIHLVSPDSTDVLLFKQAGGTGNNFTSTVLGNAYANSMASGAAPFAGNYQPTGDAGLFNNNQNGNGTWKLKVIDRQAPNQGFLTSWSIQFSNTPSLPRTVFSSNLPLVIINTQGNTIPDNPKIHAGIFIVENGSGNRNYDTNTVFNYRGDIGIEVRGSSSGAVDKKSYGFETWDAQNESIDTGLLGMPAESDWVLSASYYDKTLMHNVLSYELSNRMGHYAPRTRYCEVILNGQYVGVYMMMEKIKRDKNRVDIAKLTESDTSGDELTGGYIVKIDKFTGSGGGGFYSNYPPSNPIGDVIYYQYEYPGDADINAQQADYIRTYIDSFETALFGPDYADTSIGFRKYAGEKAFMDYMFINEMSKNVDGYRLSTYFYKDKQSKGGKLKAGPCWDYDIAWMNADYCQAQIDTGWAYNLNYVCPGASVPAHWERMMSDSLFRGRVKCRWNYLRSHLLSIDSMYAFIDSTVARIDEAQQRNFQRWPILGVATWPEPFPLPQTYGEEIQRLKGWIQNRLTWLDSQIAAFPDIRLGVNLGSDTTLCAGTYLVATPGDFDNYAWSDNTSQPQLQINQSGVYTLTVSDQFNCMAFDSLVVAFSPALQVDLGPDTTLCAGSMLVINPGTYDSYSWSDSSSLSLLRVSESGVYALTVADQFNCTADDSLKVTFSLPLQVNLGPDTSLCEGNVLPLHAGNFASYVWSNGADSAAVNLYTAGIYAVTVADSSGCMARDTMELTFTPLPDASFSLTLDSMFAYSFTAHVSTAATYQWQLGDGDTSSLAGVSHVYQADGNYVVQLTLTDQSGCSSTYTDTVTIIGTGVMKLPLADIAIYPNPATERVIIQSGNGIDAVVLTSATGQVVYSAGMNPVVQTEMDISRLSPGIYFLKVSSGGYTVEHKLIKQ